MMTPEEILTKAIEKAIEGGWDKFGNPKHNYRLNEFTNTQGNKDIEFKLVRGTNDVCYYTINDIIYNHDFAKALWGEELNLGVNEYHRNNITSYPLYEWQWKLTQMVIADDPIVYLGDNLPA